MTDMTEEMPNVLFISNESIDKHRLAHPMHFRHSTKYIREAELIDCIRDLADAVMCYSAEADQSDPLLDKHAAIISRAREGAK